MKKKKKNYIKIVLIFLFIVSFSKNIIAQEFGSKEEALVLLERAIALVKVDKNRALDIFTTGKGGTIINDLYIFCFAPDYTITAHPKVIGLNIYENGPKDLDGNNLAERMANEAKPGVTSEIQYKLRKYNTESEEEFLKTTLYTKIQDQVCGVGYYN